ncbi:MAG: hypothetical protein AAF790_15655, partial [Planctomycetota bacterium]
GAPAPGQPQDRVTLTPERVLAPVGSEVVLRAGVCAASGYLITNRRIDWLLGAQGVGQIVEIAEEGQPDVLRWPWERPKKVDNRYAVGYTSPYHTCLRRSLADPADDLQIRPGDAWVSVSSATEGTSYVTAYNPDVTDWAARKASAVIYWVDAQWRLPAPATVQAGRPYTLTTSVTRQTDGTPIAGWLVRYEVADGSGAALGYGAGQSAEATTDSQGRASIEIKPTDDRPGVSTVNITIVRPAAAGMGPRINIGSGQTSVAWVAGLPATGLPDAGPPGTGLPGTGLPPISPSPTPAPTPAGPPLDLTPPPAIPTPTGRPELTVQLRRETPDPIRVNDTVRYVIIVRNIGDAPARNIVITDRFDPGLSQQFSIGNNIVDYTEMRDLAPGQQDQVPLDFGVLQPGRRSHEVTVTADGAREAFTRDAFEALPVTPPAPTVEVALVVPPTGEVRQTLRGIRGVIRNTGATPATNVVVQLFYDPTLEPTRRQEPLPGDIFSTLTSPAGFQWVVPRIEPGQTRRFGLECIGLQPTPRACLRLLVTGDGGLNDALKECIEVLPALGPGAGVGPG